MGALRGACSLDVVPCCMIWVMYQAACLTFGCMRWCLREGRRGGQQVDWGSNRVPGCVIK